jgi:hypothetical protein
MRRWIGPLAFALLGVAIMVALASIEQPVEATIIAAELVGNDGRWDVRVSAR